MILSIKWKIYLNEEDILSDIRKIMYTSILGIFLQRPLLHASVTGKTNGAEDSVQKNLDGILSKNRERCI